MRGLKKRRRIQVLAITAASLALTTGLVAWTMREGIQFFRTPTQIVESPPAPTQVLRIGGLVEEGSMVRQGTFATFRVTDTNAAVPLRFEGILPDLVKEGDGVVATGRMEGDTFVATEVLARHDERYMPPEVVEALKAQGVYVDPNAGANAAATTN